MKENGLKHRVLLKLPDTDCGHIEDWCEIKFGIKGINWDSWYADDSPWNYDRMFTFVKQEDAVLFSLTWV